MASRREVYLRRTQIARARGFKSLNQYVVAAAAHPPDRRIQGRRQLGGGQETIYTRSDAQLRAAIARAARNDLVCYARVTILDDPGDGSHPRTWRKRDVEIWADHGWRAELLDDAVDATGTAFAVIKETLDSTHKYPGPILDVLLRAVAA